MKKVLVNLLMMMVNANVKMDFIIIIREVALKFLLLIVKKGMLLIVISAKDIIM